MHGSLQQNAILYFCHLFLLILDYFTGTKVEGILRQSADVEEVDRRVQEYEQGFCACLYLSVFFFLNCF